MGRFGSGSSNSDNSEMVRAELILGIKDVSGKPLECKSCDLEVTHLKSSRDMMKVWDVFSRKCDEVCTKIRINEVWKRDEGMEAVENSVGVVLMLQGIPRKCNEGAGDSKEKEFIVQRILQVLSAGTSEFMVEKPVWQLLLAFLFRGNYYASVSMSDSAGNSFEGILKPFTVNYALLCIMEKNISVSKQLPGNTKITVSAVADSSEIKNEKRKRNKVHKHQLLGISWSSFYEMLLSKPDRCAQELNLEEIYYTTDSSKSKKLQFLKCWMRQMKKSTDCCLYKPNELEETSNVKGEMEEGNEVFQEELDLSAPISPALEAHQNVPVNQEVLSYTCLGDLEAFLASIPQKIEHGICSKEVDLWNLAQRLVGWSIDALYAKFGSSGYIEAAAEDVEDASPVNVSSEVSSLILMKPKDLMSKCKSSTAEPHVSDCSAANYSTDSIIRNHELQILFRMELLQSKIIADLEENVKQKMVKEICSLLQNIEFYLQGDFLSGESLLDFAGRVIKSRYAHSLGGVIHKIYEQMEFLSFDDDELEASDSLLGSNNEEPNKDENESDDTPKAAFEPFARDSSNRNYLHQQENKLKDQQVIADNAHDERLVKARKQRDRARRFSSFTSWVPDLRRVWAVKHPRIEKSMHESFPKSQSKRTRREKNKNEKVCETPMSGKQKHFHMQGDECEGSENASMYDSPLQIAF